LLVYFHRNRGFPITRGEIYVGDGFILFLPSIENTDSFLFKLEQMCGLKINCKKLGEFISYPKNKLIEIFISSQFKINNILNLLKEIASQTESELKIYLNGTFVFKYPINKK